MPSAETREKVAHWVQDGLRLLPHLPPLLHGDTAAARVVELERESEKLRKEVTDLRRELEELRKEHERLRTDRDEIAVVLNRLMDSVQPISQIAQKLGVRRSPFERDPKAPAPVAPPGAPTPKPG
jgi:predicted nuclease with TOPRIM domain